MTETRWVLLTVGLVGLGLAFAFLEGCCKTTVTDEVTSPDKELVATVQLRNCGPTTPLYTSVLLRDSDWAIGPFGRTLLLGFEGSEPILVKWTGPRALSIQVPPTVDLWGEPEKVDGMQIELIRAYLPLKKRIVYPGPGTPEALGEPR